MSLTKRILSERDAEKFFSTSINTMEDAFGRAVVDFDKNTIRFDFNAVLLLSFDNIYAEHTYKLNNGAFDKQFPIMLRNLKNDNSEKAHTIYYRNNKKFEVKQFIENNIYHYIFISIEKLFETEKQINLFSNVVGSGLSVFNGSIWWIDYDYYHDHFFSSNVGPKILGIPQNEDLIYYTPDFQEVRKKVQSVSALYEEAIKEEIKSYERVRNNQTDYFAARTPVLTKDDKIVWVEAYGKCILRYADGSPRFFVAIDIYLSELQEEKNQLEILSNLVNIGLTKADIGVWYYQRLYIHGHYNFTSSYKNLMDFSGDVQNTTISNLINEQIHKLKQIDWEYAEKIIEFRNLHNSIFYNKRDQYKIVIPHLKADNSLIWIEVRGQVIERNEKGEVMIFVGVNVDITDSYNRRRELERLQLANNLATRAREIMTWSQEIPDNGKNLMIFGNYLFETKLGIKRNSHKKFSYKDIIQTIVKDTNEDKMRYKIITDAIKNVYRGIKTSYDRILVKHRNKNTGEILFIEHSVGSIQSETDGNVKIIGGVLLDVTAQIKQEQKIRFLASHDTLTGLHNRHYFDDFQKQLSNDYTLYLFDLDGLKLGNDIYGHQFGDLLITKTAYILKEVFSKAQLIARIGGDEFAVICNCTNDEECYENLIKIKMLAEKINLPYDYSLQISSGYSIVHNKNKTFSKAFAEAENILYQRKLSQRFSRKNKVLESIMETLNAKTTETKKHSERLSLLAVKIMAELGLKRHNEIEDMKLLARVHDIGKITIDDGILKKPGKLTDEEFELIKKHPEAGYKIIRNLTDNDNVCLGVLHHHERWDGKGYPYGLSQKEIPLFARILAIVDSYDAMTSKRVYKKVVSPKEALEEIKANSNTQFDPEIVKAFTLLFEKEKDLFS